MAGGSLADLNPSAAGGEGGMEGDLEVMRRTGALENARPDSPAGGPTARERIQSGGSSDDRQRPHSPLRRALQNLEAPPRPAACRPHAAETRAPRRSDQAQTNPAAHWVLPWRMRCGQQSARRPRRRATRRALWPRATSRLLAVRYYHRFGFSPAPSVAPPGYPAEHFQVLPFGASLPGRLPCRLLHRRLMGSGLLDSRQPSSTEVLMRLIGR